MFLTSTPVQVFVCRSLYCCLLCFLHQHQCRFLFVVHCTAVSCVSYINTSAGFCLSFTVLLSLVFPTSTPVQVFVCRSLYCCLLCFLHQHQCRFLFVVHCTAVPCVSYINTSAGFRLSFTVLLSLVFLTSTPVQVFVCRSLYSTYSSLIFVSHFKQVSSTQGFMLFPSSSYSEMKGVQKPHSI